MNFNQTKYINGYNKENYKMYQFRVKKNNLELIQFLDNLDNRNNYILELIDRDINPNVYTIKQIKDLIKPILSKYDITNINLFGSYARGEANPNSDIDIYCNKGNIKTLLDQAQLIEELENETKKKIDLIFDSLKMDDYFKKQIMEDMIKLY